MKSNGACARMEEGNVTNNLRELSPNANVGYKSDCEAVSRAFFCYKWYLYRGLFLRQLIIYGGAFCEIS